MVSGRSPLHITVTPGLDGCVLTVGGVLDDTTYIPLRDAIVKAALDEPHALIVNVTGLAIPDETALAVFTSARWQIAEWPNVPVGLVCAHARGRHALRRNGVARYVPVYPTLRSAVTELPAEGLRRFRRRAHATLPAMKASARRCRELTSQWLTAWSRTDFIHAVSTVVTELAEDALADTDTEFSLRLESDGSTMTVVVQHASAVPKRQKAVGDAVSGLDVVAASCRVWGSYTTVAGKTVWAVLGPENRF